MQPVHCGLRMEVAGGVSLGKLRSEVAQDMQPTGPLVAGVPLKGRLGDADCEGGETVGLRDPSHGVNAEQGSVDTLKESMGWQPVQGVPPHALGVTDS